VVKILIISEKKSIKLFLSKKRIEKVRYIGYDLYQNINTNSFNTFVKMQILEDLKKYRYLVKDPSKIFSKKLEKSLSISETKI
jgi:hypothetical protein